jgi:hypothetical protein
MHATVQVYRQVLPTVHTHLRTQKHYQHLLLSSTIVVDWTATKLAEFQHEAPDAVVTVMI